MVSIAVGARADSRADSDDEKIQVCSNCKPTSNMFDLSKWPNTDDASKYVV